MARYKLQGRAVDSYGNIQPGIGVTIYLAGTTTPAKVYITETSPIELSGEPQLTTDPYGRFSFWVDTNDYIVTQFFDIYAGSLGYTDVDIFRGFRVHDEMLELMDDDHPQYGHLSQSEVVSGAWRFKETIEFDKNIHSDQNITADGRIFTGSLTPTGDYELPSKYYVDNYLENTSAASIEDVNRLEEWTIMQLASTSGASDEADQRLKEYVNTFVFNTSAATISYVDTRDASLSASVDENINRLTEYVNTMDTSLSASVDENINRLTEYTDMMLDSTSASSLEGDRTQKDYTDMRITSLSGATSELDQRQREYIDTNVTSLSGSIDENINRLTEYVDMRDSSLSASSLEGDRTQQDYTDMRITSLSGSTDENINRLYEYIDLENSTQTTQLSAASLEGDNRLWEDLGNLTGEVRSLEASTGESLHDLRGRLRTHEVSAKGLFDNQRGRLTTLEASASDRFNLIDELFVDMQDPTGFVNRTDSGITFDDSTRTFSISAVDSSFDYYIDGVVITKTGTESIEISDVEGTHFIYYDADGNLNETTIFTSDIITRYAYVANVYWNATDNESLYIGDERHGINWPGYVHWYHHVTEGTKYESGLQPLYVNPDGTGDQEKDLYLGVSQGYVWDEDLRLTISEYVSGSSIYVFHKDGDNWRRSTQNYPVIPSGGGGIAYNEIINGNGSQTLVASGGYTLAHIWATNDIDYGVIAIQGQNEYTSIQEARNDATEAINLIVTEGLPFAEFAPIATLIYQSSPNYGNSAGARVRSTDDGNDYIDFRGLKGGGVITTGTAGSGISNHSNLAGLSNDDHLQYPNRDGSRDFTGRIGGITPTEPNHLTTKQYVDNEISTESESLSGSIDENINRLTEYVDDNISTINTTTDSISAASREQDNRVREYTDTQIVSLSGAVVEGDRTLYDYIDALPSSASIVLYGDGNPATERGGVNDYYIDSLTGNIWKKNILQYTDDLTGSGTPSAASSLGGTPADIFDDSLSSTPLTLQAVTSDWISYEFTSPETVTRFGIIPREGYLSRQPDSVNVYGSDNGNFAGEEVLIEEVDLGSWSSFEFRYFDLNNNTSYLAYKFEIADSGGISYWDTQEVELLGTVGYTWGIIWNNETFTNNLSAASDEADQRIYEYIDTQNEVTSGSIINHIENLDIHREIDDTSTSLSALWSSQKIETYFEENAGSNFIYGNNSPSASEGSSLDYYIKTTTGDIWRRDVAAYGSNEATGGTVTDAGFTNQDDAFDGNLTNYTYCQPSSGEKWIQYQMTSGKIISRLRLKPYPTDPSRWMDEFYFYGSITGAFAGEEIELLHETGIPAASTTDWEIYDFENTNEYVYYRLVLPAGSNHSLTGLVYFSEIEMIAVSSYDWQKIWDNETFINNLSASSVEGDRRQQEYTDTQIVSLSAAVVEQDNRTYQLSTNYTDTQITSLSAASEEADQRIYEYGDANWTGGGGSSVDPTKIINSNDVVKTTGTGSVEISASGTQLGVFKTNRTELYAPQLEIGVSGGYFEEGETNPSGSTALGWNGYLYATKVYNAVYNDIADFQELDDDLVYGKCYYRASYGMKICCERLQKGVVGIASDTYGYGLGVRDNCVPLAIGGWVMAYVDGKVESGDALTVNEDGNLCKMEMWEKVFWPERIVAIYQYKEPEEIWNDIKVNGRHWVKIK